MWRSLFLNLLFAIYALFGSDKVIGWTEKTLNSGEPSRILGGLLVGAILLEPFAVTIKLSGETLREAESNIADFVLWALHSVVGVLLSLIALTAFGFNISGDWNAAVIAVVVITILKELFLLVVIILRPHWTGSPLAADCALFFFPCIAYTATWEVMAKNGEPVNQQNIVLTLVYFTAAFLLFLFFYLPARMTYVMEELRAAG